MYKDKEINIQIKDYIIVQLDFMNIIELNMTKYFYLILLSYLKFKNTIVLWLVIYIDKQIETFKGEHRFSAGGSG